jgi:hypothetical protein
LKISLKTEPPVLKSIVKIPFFGFEVLTEVIMKISIFWDIKSRSPLKVDRRFGRSRLHLQGRRINYAINQREADSKESFVCYLLHGGFLLGSFFDSEDGGDIFLRRFRCLFTDYTALYPRRQNSS